ncbi:DUF305 domain-containing protein [Mycobacterium sp. E740]|uniref:DUF305 domain-containing protein n=1 Tax=Mycobacterium sp. E740 TaxID=1834149 RepID=UPI0007FBE3AA|nr:DUF305 domain-containing protein [Mycobacterium sp. E740]OBI82336.1 DUF305 domain-containing protein [Mycobacterium sp. E740]
MTSLITRLAAVLIAFTTALLLTACSSQPSDGHTDHEPSDQPAISGQPAGFNADDIAFATNMIPHHQQAVDLSELVPQRSTNPKVKALAEQISSAQGPEIQAMKVLLVQWNENPESGSGHGGHGDGAMQGMVDDATMAKLKSLSGAEFDTLWLQSMIGHHQGAIEMAKAELANGENVDAKRLAQTMVDTQQAEIGEMNQLLKG